MRISRLIEMTLLLINRRTVTFRELEERFCIHSRTIYRDIEVLSASGIPIYTNHGRGGRILLMDNSTLNRVPRSEQEENRILLELKSLQTDQFLGINKIFDKITAYFKNVQANDWVEVDCSSWGSDPTKQDIFNALKGAVVNRLAITFDYVNNKGHKVTWAVEPLRIYYKENAWYLAAYCRRQYCYRQFRMSRIKNAVVTNKTFSPELLVDWQNDDLDEAATKVLLRLEFKEKVLNRVYDDFDEKFLYRKDNGNLVVEVCLPENEWLYGYILSYGSYVEVLEPSHIRTLIINRLKKAAKIYGN